MMELKVQMTIDVSDRLANILQVLNAPLFGIAAPVSEETKGDPLRQPAEGKRGRGRPRKDEQQAAEPVEQAKPAAAEQPAAEGIDPNELWARAKLVAGSSKEHAQAIRDALSVMGVMRLSAVPPDKFVPFNACLDRLYEGEDIAEAIAALTEEISK
jgi:hypothetical protein